MTVGFGIILMINIVAVVMSCSISDETPFGHNLHWFVGQFKFNMYIRYYMLCFFDLTFFSIMKLVDASEGNDSSKERKMATLASYVIFTLSLVMPVFFVTVVCVRQPVMRIKGAKSQFNTLVCKVDKGSRARLFTTFYYFFRRLLTAMFLAIPSDNTYIFL
jgi:magnesium-transporting ATPase (P-type)